MYVCHVSIITWENIFFLPQSFYEARLHTPKILISSEGNRKNIILNKQKRLAAYLSKYSLISNRQYGSRENFSSQDALLALTSKASSVIDENTPTLCDFIDLSKAFDTVSHEYSERLG